MLKNKLVAVVILNPIFKFIFWIFLILFLTELELFFLFIWVYFLPPGQSIENYDLFYRLIILLVPLISSFTYYRIRKAVPNMSIKHILINITITMSPYFAWWFMFAKSQVRVPSTTFLDVLIGIFDAPVFFMYIFASFLGAKFYILSETKRVLKSN